MAERDANASLIKVDDFLARIDNEMINVSYFMTSAFISCRIVLILY